MGVLVYAFFENKDSLIMVAVNCVFLWLLYPGATNFGHQGRQRENGGRRSVWKLVTALKSVLQCQCYGTHCSEAAVSV